MKRLNILKCNDCGSYLEYEPEDIRVVMPNRYRVNCSCCKSENRIGAPIFYELYPNGKPAKEFKKKEKTPAPKQEQSKKEFDQAVEAAEALGKHGSQAKAAKAVGISIPTLVKRLKSLPPQVEAGSN